MSKAQLSVLRSLVLPVLWPAVALRGPVVRGRAACLAPGSSGSGRAEGRAGVEGAARSQGVGRGSSQFRDRRPFANPGRPGEDAAGSFKHPLSDC